MKSVIVQRMVCIVFVLTGVLCLNFLWVPSASAQAFHAILLRSQPAQGDLLSVSPKAICLWFSESAQAVGNSIDVLGPDGKHIQTGALQIRGVQFCVPLSLHIAGSYLVSWQVISLDTDPSSGSFTFNLHYSGGVWTTTTNSGTSPQGLILQVLARLLHFLGYALCFGILAFRWFVLKPLHLQRESEIQRRLAWLILLGIGILILAEPLALLAQVASLVSADIGSLLGAILASSFGRVLAQRLGIALLVWVILGMINGSDNEQEEPRSAKIVMLGLGLLLALVDGEASHAVSKEPIWLLQYPQSGPQNAENSVRPPDSLQPQGVYPTNPKMSTEFVLGLLANMVHIASMGLWVGGLIALLFLWRVKSIGGRRREITLRFGQLATIAVCELIISGLLMAWLQLNQPLNLLTTVYGRVLLAKICLLPIVLLLAWIGRRKNEDEQAAWWQWEGLGLLGLLVTAGLLVALPPPL